MKLGEFFVALGFQVEDKALKNFENKVTGLKKKLLSFPVLVTAAAYAVDRFVASSVRGAVALQNFNRQTGLLSSDLQRYQFAGQLSDIALSSEQVAGAVGNLQSNLAAIRLGGGNVAGFQLSGIDVIGKNAFEVIEEIRTAFQSGRMGDRATAANLLDQMGLGREFIRILELSRMEFEALGNQFIRSPKLIKALEDMGTAMTKLKMALGFLKDTFVGFFANTLKGVSDVTTNIIYAFTRIIQLATDFMDRFTFVGHALKSMAKMIAIGFMVAFAPVTSLLTALFLAIDDVATYMQGGKSWTGRLVNQFKEIGDAIGNFFKAIIDKIMTLIDAPIKKLQEFMGKVKSFLDMPKSAFEKVKDLGNRGLKAATNNNMIQTTINIVTQAGEDAVDAIYKAGNRLNESIALTYDELTAGDSR